MGMLMPISDPTRLDVVERPVDVLGGDDAERDADDDGEHHRREGQLDGRREALAQLVDDRALASSMLSRSRREAPARGTCRTARRAAGRGRTGARWRPPPPASPVRRAVPAPVRRAAPASTRTRGTRRRGGPGWRGAAAACRVASAMPAAAPLSLLDRHRGEVLRGDRAGDEAHDVRAEREVRRRVGERHAGEEVHDRCG